MTLEKETEELFDELLFGLFASQSNVRKKRIEHLIQLINNKDLNESSVCQLCSELRKVLTSYCNRNIQVLFKNVVICLLKKYSQICLEPVVSIIVEFAAFQRTRVTTFSTSCSSLSALEWIKLIFKYCSSVFQKENSTLLKNLVSAQVLLVASLCEVSSCELSTKTQRILHTSWFEMKDAVESYADILLEVEPSVGVVILGSNYLSYSCEKPLIISKYKVALLDVFVKVIICGRTKVNLFVIRECQCLLNLVQETEFEKNLLPAIQKSMLRNPEIILQCISCVISNLSFDLSKYVLDIGKNFASSLHSKNDATRDEAADGLLKIAEKCYNVEVLAQLLNHLFNVFHGSEGKLSLASQKISVLQSIGNLSRNPLPGEVLHQLIEPVLSNFIKILDMEVHEKTLLHVAEMLQLWCLRFTWTCIPLSLISCIKIKMTSKNSLPLVNAAIIGCLDSCLRDEELSQSLDLADLLLQSFDKSISFHTQVNYLIEGLAASCLLFKLSEFSNLKDHTKLSSFWNTVLGSSYRAHFVSDKLLNQASDSVLKNVLFYTQYLICHKRDKLIEVKPSLYKAIIFCSLTRNLDIRRCADKVILNCGNSENGIEIILELLNEFSSYVDSINLQDFDLEICSNETTQRPLTYNSATIKKLLVQTMFSMCTGPSFDACDKEKIAMNCLIPSHHPNLDSSSLWISILTRLSLKPAEFIINNEKKLIRPFVENYDGSMAAENTVATLTRIQPESVLPLLLKRCTIFLESDSLINITSQEYDIFLTAEGELYNKKIIEELQKNESDPSKNMKRESKVYSFKEQQEELQLRKEIEEKKKRAGLTKPPEMSEKQKEQVKQELEKEAVVRKRLKILNTELKLMISLIRGAASGNKASISLRFRFLIPLILRNTKSPLAAQHLCQLFIQLRNCVFTPSQKQLAIFLAYLTLRHENPNCKVNKAWTDEDLGKASQRALEVLIFSENFSGPTFSYFFWFLRNLMISTDADVTIVMDVLKIISKHSEMRGKKLGKKLNLNAPKLLPRTQMFDSLILIIGKVGGFLQQTATKTLVQVAASCAADEGCDPALPEELNCLLSGLQSFHPNVRDASMKALFTMISAFPSPKKDYQLSLKVTKRIWVAKHDVFVDNRELAENVWNEANLDFRMNNLAETLLDDVVSRNPDIQEAASKALANLLQQLDNSVVNIVVKKLMNLYQEKLKLPKCKKDEFGRVVEDVIDVWESRNGIGIALEQLASLVTNELVTILINFYVSSGLRDPNEQVRGSMLTAGAALVSLRGKEYVGKLLPIFENFLKKTPASGDFDAARSGVIVLMGTLARHLDNDDAKLKPIVNKLIETLSTPSQQVQESVAESLHPLIVKTKDEAPAILKKLLSRLLNGATYGDRKGAAYGIAAVVKGVGILSLKQYDIMSTLTDAIQDKKNYKHREGALFALEQLCCSVGRLFEPYIIHILPHLLLCFGDNSEYVRTAADDCAKIVMSKLSGHGVKLVLPALLNALEDDSWRTKTGSVELLGAMAFCAPKQLSSCLPSIVPKLIEVLSDSHIKVQEAGAQALRVIGSVIRNPEIQAIVNTLLDALQDPPNKIAICLSTLLNTKFIHFIDAPSLALIMPVVQRAFMDRSTETRKMAAQIIGNMYSLTDEKDLTPYLPTIMPGLKNSLLDPVPEVRSVSARALGAMVRGMGESSFEDLLPWLMKTLTSEASSVDRSGAAQGLSEVVGGLGLDKLHKLMPEIIATADRTDIAPHVKDGYLMMFIYMPAVFGSQFTPYIGQIIVPILKALADENEYVRETALKAGQRIVNMYAESAIQLLLPELEKGLFDDNWRIRFSSVQLLGDLLYRISGVTGKMSTETANEDDNFGTEHSHKIIITALGEERRNRVLAGLYMGRSDVSLLVRQAALHVWKVVVTNTPRTLREILTTLFSLLLGCLASPNFDKRQVGARTLGDLVRKLGERVLPEIIPLLEKGLESDDPEVRQGVCIGLCEIVKSTSRDMILAFISNLIPTVRKTLCDPLPEVRRAAAKTFDSLHATVGVKALDDILPFMLQQLKSDDAAVSERALDGLRQVMTIKSRVVLPYLIPQLTAPPINTKVLAILASVAGDALTKYLHKILPALLKVVASSEGECEMEHCQAVVLAVVDEAGIRVIMDQLQEATKSDNPNTRKAAINLLSSFCMNSKGDYSQYVPQLLRIFIHLLTDKDEQVLQLSWEALNAVTKSLNSDQQISVVTDVRQAMKHAANEIDTPEKILPGFCLKKGISPLIPIFREAMLNGTTEVKEQGALGLGEAIKLSSKESLQGNVVAITGPLIRAVGERFVGNVKAAVIETLAILLHKVGLSLKQFLPQLLTTFLKSLMDPHRQVRLKAAFALSRLVLIHGKADPLFLELYTAVKTTEDSAIKETLLHTLRVVMIPAGDRMSDQVRRSLFMMLRDMLGHNEDTVRSTAAAALACLMRWLSAEQLNVILAEHILVEDASVDATLKHGRSTALFVALKENASYIYTLSYSERINRTLILYLQSSKVPIVTNGIRGCGYLFLHLLETERSLPSSVLVPFARSINHANNDIKQLLAKVCSFLGKATNKLSSEFLKIIVPMLVNGTKEKNSFVKAHCEFALIAVLRLREGDSVHQECMQILEAGAKESLNDVVTKVLKRVADSQFEGKDEDLDDTVLS